MRRRIGIRGEENAINMLQKYAEIPKQINPTGFKRVLKASRFPRRIRFGFKPNLPDLGEDPVRFQTEPTGPGGVSGSVRKPNLPGLGKTQNYRFIF